MFYFIKIILYITFIYWLFKLTSSSFMFPNKFSSDWNRSPFLFVGGAAGSGGNIGEGAGVGGVGV